MSLTESIPQIRSRTVALARCDNYHPHNVRRAVRQAIDHLGDLQDLIHPGDRVLLKPNMLSAKEPERAVTTHPEVIAAVGELISDCRGRIVLGDSPAGAAKNLNKYWDKTGIARAAKRLGIAPMSFEDAGAKSFPAPEGHVSISRAALDVDLIINLPKLKTHQLVRMTGAVKNMFGTVPGFRKGDLHGRAPEPLRFSRFVLAVYRQVVPALNIMDAVVGMEGNGPSSGHPRHIGLILAARDALDLDSVAAQIIGAEESKLPLFQAAAEIGLWSMGQDGITVLGEALEEFRIRDFKKPDISRLERIPPFVLRNLKRVIWVRPKADQERCSSCGICVENCPQQAMIMKNGIPKIDYALCIKCGCCDEVCPDRAIFQEMSHLARFLS